MQIEIVRCRRSDSVPAPYGAIVTDGNQDLTISAKSGIENKIIETPINSYSIGCSFKSRIMSTSIRHEMIDNFYRTISPALITRFKEREENVKSDIFHAYIALLRQTKPVTGIAAPDPASMEAEEGPVSLLQAQVNLLTNIIRLCYCFV